MPSRLGQALAALAGSVAAVASADVSVFPPGPPSNSSYVPFGCGTAAMPLNISTSHQVFASSLFSDITAGGPVTITDIGFASQVAGVYNSSVTVRLGYTTRYPGFPSPGGLSPPDAGGGGAPNASGPMSTFYSNGSYAATIPAPSTSDFTRIHFPGSFVYNPTLGNLLVEVVNEATFGATVDVFVSCTSSSRSSVAFTTTRFGAFELISTAARMQFTYTVQTYPTGACCLPDTTCVTRTQAQCAALNGVYQGHSTPCTGDCQPRGACCRFDGSCIPLISPEACAQLGVFQGPGSACGNCPTPAPVIHANCNISTGPATLSGVAAPAHSVWSELARDDVSWYIANGIPGFRGNDQYRLADDFTVPAGGMNVALAHFYAYTNGLTAPSITAATVRIWSGPPHAGGVVIFGDTTTNRLVHNEFSNIYRVYNTVVGPFTCQTYIPPTIGRRLQDVYVAINQFLPEGTYWLDYAFVGASFSPTSTRADAIGRQCDPSDSNALQFNGTGWAPLVDNGDGGCIWSPLTLGLYFRLFGTPAPSACYPNCDASTAPPCVNIQDFACFLNRFAAGDTYANCDSSTVPPTLNIQDFSCFLNKFAVGCSTC